MKPLITAFALLFFTFLSSCTQNSIVLDEAIVEVEFIHLNNGDNLVLDKVKYTNAVGQDYSIKTVKYFISKITFYNANGNDYISSDIHFVDIREIETLSFKLSSKIPYGNYTGLSFVYGLLPEDNITGSLGLALDRLMEWPVPMGGGYHYLKLEGSYKGSTGSNFFNFHAGSLDGKDYSIPINFSVNNLLVKDKELKLNLIMNIDNWFKNPINWDFEYWGSGIMGNPEAQATVQKNGTDVFSITFPKELN